jgi:hypothetical protein
MEGSPTLTNIMAAKIFCLVRNEQYARAPGMNLA